MNLAELDKLIHLRESIFDWTTSGGAAAKETT